jgi:tetratricopeptide (TPR) repeat protein
MKCELLSLSGFIKEMTEVSSGPHPRKFCFVLGAGASKASGIKSGQELVNLWEKDLLERNKESHLQWKEQLKINDTNKYSFYSQYYERRFKRPMDGYNYLEKIMESAKPSVGYVMLSYLLTHTRHNVVITTNFDHLIEDSVNYYEHTIPMVIGHESLAHYVTKEINRPMIVKIHRDLLLDPKNRTSELDVLHDNWRKGLENLFSEYHPIFIGYAGNDHSLMDFLNQNVDKFSSGEWKFPYWMLYKTDGMSEMVSAFLEHSDGYLIRHNGFDEVLYLLGAAFEYELPAREEFLSDAQKRFQILSDSIDAFTEKALAEPEMVRGEKERADEKTEDGQEVEDAIQKITSQGELQRQYSEALYLVKTGNYEKAESMYRKLVEKEPENPRYYYALGVTLDKLKRYEEALKAKKTAVELEPDNAAYHVSLGVAYYQIDQYEEASEEIKKGLELEPDCADYHSCLGLVLNETGRWDEALREMQRALELEPNHARNYYRLGIVLSKMRRYEEALRETKKAVELKPDFAEYHDTLGMILYMLGRYEEALKEVEQALEMEPENKQYLASKESILSAMKSDIETVE